MKSVRQKWASHKTYRKIQKAWLDYTSIADKSGDVQTVAQRLDVFLNTFEEAYQEMIPQAALEQTEVSTEKIYGDCSEIMTTLFNAIERETSLKKADRAKCMQEPMNKALLLINLILKEEKYRWQVSESPNFISRLLALLEKPGSPETKILFLRIVATIGESDRNKIEIAKMEGYKKILRLLISDNPELTQEVVTTVNHLLEFSNDHPDIADLALVAPGLKASVSHPDLPTDPPRPSLPFNPKSLLSRSSVQLSRPQVQDASLPPRPKSVIMDRHISRGPSPFDSPRRPSSNSPTLKSVSGIDRVSQAISEVRGMFVQELGKIFPQLKDQDGLGILGMGSDESGVSSSEKHYIPNEEQIRFTIAYYSQLMSSGDSTEEPETQEPTDHPDPPTEPEAISSKPSQRLGDMLGNERPNRGRRGTLKKTASTPDFRVAQKPALLARRNSEDKQLSEVSWATRGAAVELAQEEEMMRKSQPDNVLKEFMRTQGALKSLMTILSESPPSHQNVSVSKKSSKNLISTGTRLATKIDIMETVCKVLFQNSANQCEFKAMDGYTTLLKVFDDIVVPGHAKGADGELATQTQTQTQTQTDDSGSVVSIDSHSTGRLPESQSGVLHGRSSSTVPVSKRGLLLGSLLAVFFDLALDGSARDMVQNTDAFHFLFRLLLESKQLDVRQQALYAIQDLISLNSLNAVAAWRCGQVDAIVGLLRTALSHHSTSTSLYEAQWDLANELGFDARSTTSRSVVFSRIHYFDHFIVSEDTGAVADMVENGSPVYQYVVALTRLLEYISVMLVQDNAIILYELSRLIMEIEFPDESSIVVNIVLRSIGRIVSDMVARGVSVEEKFASIYLQIVRRIVDNQGKNPNATLSDLDEQEQELRDSVHTEQRLLTLHVLGLVLKGMGSSIDVFDLLQGFDVLASTILLEKRSCHHAQRSRMSEPPNTYAESLAATQLCQDCFRSDIVVSDLALWIFRDLALQEPDNGSVTTWMIHLLKSTLAGIEELRRQTESVKLKSRFNSGFLHIIPDLQQDQAHALLAYLYTKICGTVSLIFRKSGNSKLAFGEACGMQILLSILSSAQHQDIATAALVAIGDFFAGYEGTKALLGDKFGYDGFLEIVLDSCRPLDKVCCEIVLEVATVGNVMSVKSRPHVESDRSIYCTEVWPFIGELSDPQLRFHAALPFTNARKVGDRNSFRIPEPSPVSGIERRPGSRMYSTNGRGTPSRPSSVYLEESADSSVNGATPVTAIFQTGSSTTGTSGVSANNTGPVTGANRYSIFGMPSWSNSAAPSISISTAQDDSSSPSSSSSKVGDTEAIAAGSSRRSSVHLHRSGLSTPAIVADSTDFHPSVPGATVVLKALQPPTKDRGGVVANRKRSNSRNLGGFGLNTTNLGFQSVMPSERMAFKQLAGIVFRDADAARMTLRLLGRIIACNNPKLATDYFNLLMLLMEVTPRNKELLGCNDGLRFMLQILFGQGLRNDGLGIAAVGYPYLPKPTDPPYVDLVPAMGAYDISVDDVRMLFDAVYDPLDMFLRLTSDNALAKPPLVSDIKDQLGPLPELPTQFGKDQGSRRNSARPRSESVGAFPSDSGRKVGGNRNNGASSSSLVGPQINPLFIGEMEQQMMYAIEKISERVDPPAYFNFNGLNASLTTYPGTVEKVISAKGGYTVSVWIKVTAFLEKETGLFCYEEENGTRTIFELYFKSLDQSNRFCLCVRTQHYPSPPEDYVFDRFDFAETGIWHHIVFVHHKTMKLMVDGCTIQSYGTFNQRRQDKDSVMLGVFGRKGRHAMSGSANSPNFSESASTNSNLSAVQHDTSSQRQNLAPSGSQPPPAITTSAEPSLGYFCGQADKVHFLQGEWDQATAEKVYNLGPSSTESWKSHDIKSTVITVLDPEEFKRDMEKTEQLKDVPRSGSKAALQLVLSVSDAANSCDDRFHLTHGVLQGGCTIHKTQAMRNLIGEVGGIQLCFRFLEMSPSHLQLVGLRVISNLLYKSPENLAHFQTELNGYEIMYELLMNTVSELSIEHFGVLFDIAINGMIKDEHLILSNMPCVQLILRLLPSVADSVQGYILRTLVDLIVESSENMHLWRSFFGMTTLFDLLRSLPAHLRPFLMWTLESMVDGITVQELGLLIGFIGHEESDLFEVRRDIIEMLFKRMTTDHYLVDLLGSGLEGVTVLIGLLDSPNEHFRVLILKMIGILLNDNTKSGKAALDKPNIGIALIRSTLEKYPLSMDVIQVLLGLAQNSYRCDPVYRPDKASSRKSAEKGHGSSLTGPPVPPKDIPVVQSSTAPALQDHGLSLDENSPSATHGQVDHSSPRKYSHASLNGSFIKPSTIPEMARISGTPKRTASPAVSITGGAGGAKITDELTYASMIRLILELTGSLPHTDLVTHTLTDLKRLLTSENMRILWEAGWVNWAASFIMDKTKVRVTSAAENLSYNRAMGVLDGIMQKMMIFDLSRRGSVTVRNKGKLVTRDEDVGVQLRLTEAALAWFDKNPNLDTDAANVICKGLVILFRRVEELSKKFEEKQRQQEKARQEALEHERGLRAQHLAQEQERERIALEAVSSALSGVLNSLGAASGDDFETKSVLFKADEGDTDAEELTVERGEESSFGSDGADVMMGPGAPLSGATSPTGSSTSTLSLPLSTFSAAVVAAENNYAHSRGYRTSGQHTRDSFESSGLSRSPAAGRHGSMEESHTPVSYQPHHHRHQTNRRHQQLQSRSSSSTPPALLDHTSAMLMMHHHDVTSGAGIFWPPLVLYEHFANCVNNLACYNNSAIRSAMKSSGLFKIRDSLIEKLGSLREESNTGSSSSLAAPYPSYMPHPLWHQHQVQQHQHQPQPLQHHNNVALHHPSPLPANNLFGPLNPSAQHRSLSNSSSSSPTYKEEVIVGNYNNGNINNTNQPINTLNNSTPNIGPGSPSSPALSSSGAKTKDPSHGQHSHLNSSSHRKRQSQRANPSGLGLSLQQF